MKYLRTFAVIFIIGMFYTSCVKKENYPDYPVISYNNWEPFCTGSTTDSAYLRINFTDGNGQIGYPAGDAGVTPDYYIVPMNYNTSTGQFDTITVPSVANPNVDTTLVFAYQIPNITPTGNDKELNGIIQINLENLITEITQVSVPQHDINKLQFKVWIYDLQGNKSNVLITPTCSTCAEE